MIPTVPVRPWTGDAATLRAHGEAVLLGMGVPPCPAPGLLAAAISPVGRDPFSPSLNAGLSSLLGAVSSRTPGEARDAGMSLTGLGGGSTPLGDDYLLGALLGVRAMGGAVGFDAADRDGWSSALVPADAASRTTPLSAFLLNAGAEGRAPEPLHGILEPGLPGLGSALGRVTTIGATSGRGCAAAIGAAALLLGSAPARTDRRRTARTS